MRNSDKTVRIVLTLACLALMAATVAPALAAEGTQSVGAAMKPEDATKEEAEKQKEALKLEADKRKDAIKQEGAKFAYLGAALGAGMVAIGAGVGIGRLAAAAADGVARQPQAVSQITGAVQLPLFLLEGVAVIGVVTCLLVVVLK